MDSNPQQPPQNGKNRPQGVYTKARPVSVLGAEQLGVPLFFTRDFFLYIFRFLFSAERNPVFYRELLRIRRRMGFFGKFPWSVYLMGSFALGIPIILVLQLIQGAATGVGRIDYFAFGFYGIPSIVHAGVCLWAMFQAAASTQLNANRAAMAELHTTLLKPAEIAWGIVFGILTTTFPIAISILPGYLAFALFVNLETDLYPMLTKWNLTTYVFNHVISVFGSLFLATAISTCFSYGGKSFGEGLIKGLFVWLAFAVSFAVVSIISGSWINPLASIGLIALISFIKVAAGCGFLHHMARRLAIDQAHDRLKSEGDND